MGLISRDNCCFPCHIRIRHSPSPLPLFVFYQERMMTSFFIALLFLSLVHLSSPSPSPPLSYSPPLSSLLSPLSSSILLYPSILLSFSPPLTSSLHTNTHTHTSHFLSSYTQGTLRGFDQTVNLILAGSHERVYSTSSGVEVVQLGLYIIRGDNM